MSYFTFKPKRDIRRDPLARLRARCNEVRPFFPIDTITSIAAVGAVYAPEVGFGESEFGFLRSAIDICARLNLEVHLKCKVLAFHKHRKPEEDFLDPNTVFAADMVVVCNEFSPPYKQRAHYINRPDDTGISRYHKASSVWHDAAVRCGAKVIVPCGGKDSVKSAYFRGTDFDEQSLPHRQPDIRRILIEHHLAIKVMHGRDPG